MESMEIVEQLNKANGYIKKKKALEAERILDKLLKEIEPIEINKYGRILDFSTRLEFFLYCHMDRKINISWTRNFLSDVYLMKGMIRFEDKKFKEAIAFFENALKWNPAGIHIYNEILETCMSIRDYEKFDVYFQKAMMYAARPIDIAMLYKKLGVVYIDKGKNETAYNLFLYSKMFFPRAEADQEISFLEKRFGTKLKCYQDLGCIEYLKEQNMLYERPKYIIPTYISLVKSMEEMMRKEKFQTRENYLQWIDYLYAIYFHKPNEQIHTALLSVQREYELKFSNNR